MSKWKIWFKRYRNGEYVGAGVLPQEYTRKRNAVQAAKKHFTGTQECWFEWCVSIDNPYED